MIANNKIIQYSVLAFLATPLILITTDRCSYLNCESLKQDYVIHQLEQQYIYGLSPNLDHD